MKRREMLQSLATMVAAGTAPASGLLVRDESDQIRSRGFHLNHVLIRVSDVLQARKFYVETFGFREAFSAPNEGRSPGFTYLQISKDTFLELQPASDERPPGLGHIGLEVASVDETVRTLRQRGVEARDPATSPRTGARISSVQAAPGVTFELLEFPPNSLARKAMKAWK